MAINHQSQPDAVNPSRVTESMTLFVGMLSEALKEVRAPLEQTPTSAPSRGPGL